MGNGGVFCGRSEASQEADRSSRSGLTEEHGGPQVHREQWGLEPRTSQWGFGTQNQSVGFGTQNQSVGFGTQNHSVGCGTQNQSVGCGTQNQSVGFGTQNQTAGRQSPQGTLLSTPYTPAPYYLLVLNLLLLTRLLTANQTALPLH